jgi:PAS domain S-box-containing protein
MEGWYSHAMPLVGRRCHEAYHGSDSVCRSCPSVRTLETGLPQMETVPLTGPNGVVVGWLDLFAFPMFDTETGPVTGVIEYVRNVSQQVQAETELRSERDFLRRREQFDRALIDESPIGISVRSSDGRLLSFNRAWRQIWNMPDEVIMEDMARERSGLCLDERDSYLGPWTDEVRRIYQEGGTLHIPELPLRNRRPGAASWVSQHFYSISSPDGSVDRVVILTEDITERKSAEIALKESEERYRSLAEASHDAIFEIDREGMIRFVNTSASRMLGVPSSEALGRRMAEFFPEEIARGQMSSIMNVLLTGEPWYFEKETVMPGGSFWLGTWLVPLRGSDGSPASVLGFARDITGRIDSERREKELLTQLYSAQKMESVGRLAGGIAHDFNNLLTLILGHVELALGAIVENDSGFPMMSCLEEVLKAGDRARRLTDQLLALGRRQMLVMKLLDLNEVIRGLWGILRRLIGEDIDLVTRLDASPSTIMADFTQIEQVLMNLVVNARDAMPFGGRLTVETESVVLDDEYVGTHPEATPGLSVMVRVADTGTGMDEETLKHIFEPFFTTKEIGKGTGLGLSTVYGIVRQHGGHVIVETLQGYGSTFSVFFPCREGQVEARSETAGLRTEAAPSRTIMVVEDDFPVRKLLCRILEQSGYRVIEVEDPVMASEIAVQQGPVDLLLTDVVMPVLSGKQVADRVTAASPGTRVLYLSGYTDDVISHHGLLDDGVPFLKKPFTIGVLTERIRELLGD